MLEALRREGGVLGGEQSGHIIWLDGHVTGDGLAAALLLCACLAGPAALRGRGGDAAATRRRRRTCASTRKEFPQAVLDEAERLNEALDGRGRVLVRPSGTEPVVRVLARPRRRRRRSASVLRSRVSFGRSSARTAGLFRA